MSEPVVIALLLVIVGSAAYGTVSAAPWIPTRKRERKMLLDSLELRPGQKVYDLGSGDGSVLFGALRQQPKCHTVGLEVFLLPWLWSRLRKLFGGGRYRNARFLLRDLFRHDLSDADLAFSFLLPNCYPRLKDKFARELKDDCLVAVEAWPMPDLEPERVIAADGNLKVYIYKGRDFRCG